MHCRYRPAVFTDAAAIAATACASQQLHGCRSKAQPKHKSVKRFCGSLIACSLYLLLFAAATLEPLNLSGHQNSTINVKNQLIDTRQPEGWVRKQ